MRVVPVLDLRGGEVVRAVAGRRHEYRPIVSLLTPSADPGEVARALAEHFRLTHFYVADLDAIAGAAPDLATCARLQREGFMLWLDAGVRRVADAVPLLQAGVEGVVVGLETVAGPEELDRLCRDVPNDRLIFSVDLRAGVPLGDRAAWNHDEAPAVAARAVAAGIRRLIVLDLAHVGTGNGPGTEGLCGRLATAHPDVEIVAGGGVRGIEDLRRLRECGVQAALVASALHDGRLSPADLQTL